MAKTKNLNDLLKAAIRTFGDDHQLGKLAEECGEYVAAYFHHCDKREGGREKLIEELAGVMITSWQCRLVLGSSDVDAMIDAQLAKLERQIIEEREKEFSEEENQISDAHQREHNNRLSENRLTWVGRA